MRKKRSHVKKDFAHLPEKLKRNSSKKAQLK